jgi:hypothetical protein
MPRRQKIIGWSAGISGFVYIPAWNRLQTVRTRSNPVLTTLPASRISLCTCTVQLRGGTGNIQTTTSTDIQQHQARHVFIQALEPSCSP